MVTVGSLMKGRIITARPSTSVLDAFAQMCEVEVRHLPVVDEHGRLAGIVSQRDLLRALDRMLVAGGHRQVVTRAGDVMTKSVVKALASLPAHQAAAMMIERKIGSLPIVDTDERVIGIVTETDFVELARESLLGIAPAARAHG